MTHRTSGRAVKAAFSLLALAGFMAYAGASAAPVQAQSSATIDKLTWHLVDLTPDDGIAPSIQFFPEYNSYSGSALVNSDIQYGFWSDNVNPIPWPSQAGQIGGSPDALVTVTPDSIQTSTVIEGGLPAVWTSIPGRDFFYTRSAYITGQGSLANGITFKLGANTGLVLEGSAKVQAGVDLSTVSGSPYFTSQPYAAVTVDSESWIAAHLHRQGGDIAGTTGSDWRLDASVTDSVDSLQLAGSYVADPKSQTNTGNFQLTFLNATAGETQAVLQLALSSRIAASGVPEPGTWLMMGLGLSALAGLRRRGTRR